MVSRPAAGGGRWVEVAPERLAKWIDGFAERHGGLVATNAGPDVVVLVGFDGSTAECHVPFPPLPAPSDPAHLAAHALTERSVGVLLVRRGGYAVGGFEGTRLTRAEVGLRPRQGRSQGSGRA